MSKAYKNTSFLGFLIKDDVGVYLTLAALTGAAIMLVTIVFGVLNSFVLFPVFIFILYAFVRKSTGRANRLFLSYLLFTTCAEALFLYDFEKYVYFASSFSSIGCVILLLLVRPVILKRSTVISTHYILEFIIGFIGIGFIVGYLAYSLLPVVPSVTMFVISVIVFGFTVVAFFLLPAYNKNTINVALFFISGGYLLEMVFGFIYKYVQSHIIFLLIAMFMTLAVKIILATYLTKVDNIEDQEV